MQRLTIPLLSLLMLSSISAWAQHTDNLPVMSKVWTDLEKAEFRNCVSRISDPSRENAIQLTADGNACAFFEERRHWMNLHPKSAGRAEDGVKLRHCFSKHPLPNKSTPEEFDAAFDFCMCKAYGLPAPKQ